MLIVQPYWEWRSFNACFLCGKLYSCGIFMVVPLFLVWQRSNAFFVVASTCLHICVHIAAFTPHVNCTCEHVLCKLVMDSGLVRNQQSDNGTYDFSAAVAGRFFTEHAMQLTQAPACVPCVNTIDWQLHLLCSYYTLEIFCLYVYMCYVHMLPVKDLVEPILWLFHLSCTHTK